VEGEADGTEGGGALGRVLRAGLWPCLGGHEASAGARALLSLSPQDWCSGPG
jgi:hypothetical protein